MSHIHLRSIRYVQEPDDHHYPFSIPVLKKMDSLTFNSPVTIFVGENGSGKSTVLEGIAAAIGSITVGDESIEIDPALKEARQLAHRLKLTWKLRTKKGFFLRAEDFINFTKKIAYIKEEMKRNIEEVDRTYQHRSPTAQGLAKMPYARTLAELKQLYGEGLEYRSHGESFFDLFQARFVPNGLYLLDEPETPLSPMKQLAFISMLKEMVKEKAQFIIATHSPIIMAFPQATIYVFDEKGLRQAAYDELEHVTLTRSFLNNPTQYLRHL